MQIHQQRFSFKEKVNRGKHSAVKRLCFCLCCSSGRMDEMKPPLFELALRNRTWERWDDFTRCKTSVDVPKVKKKQLSLMSRSLKQHGNNTRTKGAKLRWWCDQNRQETQRWWWWNGHVWSVFLSLTEIRTEQISLCNATDNWLFLLWTS